VISSVRGTVLVVTTSHVHVDVGGLGYSVQITPQHALTLRVGHEVRLHTALIVREDDMSLFGFATPVELEMFDLLRGVSGVGPKSALGVLATLSPDQIATAVAAEDDGPFRKVSGIGPKTAKAVDEVIDTAADDGALPVPALLRLALARLGPQQVRS
jgi:Holliday junction DNA helicase RuvA